MIGKIILGKSFRGCINYCLHDKVQKQEQDDKIFLNRAEILSFNQSFGNDRELITQFNEVWQLNPKLTKPVMHVILSLPPGEKLPEYDLTEIVQQCAEELGFSKNQYISAIHKDTNFQHLHIVVNRIGFDGKTLSDSNNYRKIAEFCRKMEKNYGLTSVQSPKRFLSKEFQHKPRLDIRKEKLKQDIKISLANALDFQEFVTRMKSLKYEVIKSRGIAFRDSKKVYTKGSEVGFSLSTVEKQSKLKTTITHKIKEEVRVSRSEIPLKVTQSQKMDHSFARIPDRHELLKTLLDPTHAYPESPNYELLQEAKRRKKRQRPKL